MKNIVVVGRLLGVVALFCLAVTPHVVLSAGQARTAAAVPSDAAAQQEGNSKPVAWLGGRVPNLSAVDQHLTDRALVGAIDLHAHLNPDSSGGRQEPRALDAIDNARMMKARGFRGFVYKTHMDTGSAASAYFARKVVPGIEAFGRFGMNTTVGGINPAAAFQFTHIEGGYGRIVEMPTRDSSNAFRNAGAAENETRPWITPWAKFFPERARMIATVKDGQLLPEVKAFIAMMATLTTSTDARVVLATGHATNEEHALLAREAVRQGVTVLLTHPDNLPVATAHDLAEAGAYIEITASGGFAHGRDAETWAPKTVERIRQIGIEHVVLSSDAGQTDRPLPGDELAMAAKALRAHGMTDQELAKILKDNPVRLLGLSAKPAAGATGR